MSLCASKCLDKSESRPTPEANIHVVVNYKTLRPNQDRFVDCAPNICIAAIWEAIGSRRTPSSFRIFNMSTGKIVVERAYVPCYTLVVLSGYGIESGERIELAFIF